jgi:hypothetical protein
MDYLHQTSAEYWTKMTMSRSGPAWGNLKAITTARRKDTQDNHEMSENIRTLTCEDERDEVYSARFSAHWHAHHFELPTGADNKTGAAHRQNVPDGIKHLKTENSALR